MMNIHTRNMILSFVLFAMIGGFSGIKSANAVCLLFVTCSDIDDFNADTQDSINDFIDNIIDNYERWIENTFWEDGIALALPRMMEQLTMAQMKKTEIHATAMHSQNENDAMRAIQRGNVDSTNSLQPSEEHCKLATLAGGLIAAQDSSKSVHSQSMNLLRQVATGSSPAMVDRRLFIKVQKDESLCKYASRDGGRGAIDAICTGAVPTDEEQERAMVGNLSTKMTLDDDDQIALNSHAQSMFLSNRPPLLNPDFLDNDNVKVAYMEHRSVLSREMLASYCFLKNYEQRMGGDATMLPYFQQYLTDVGMPLAEIQEYLGNNPSLYAQKKIMYMAASDPKFGTSLVDSKENIARMSNILKSYQIAAMYDNLELMQCNQMMAAQLFTDELLPKGVDLQERIDGMKLVQDNRNRANEFVQMGNAVLPATGGYKYD